MMAGRDTWARWGLPIIYGLAGAGAFPLVLASFSERPLLDGLPRELFILVAAAGLYRLALANESLKIRSLRALVAGGAHFLLLLYWLDIAMVRYGRMPQWQAVPVLFLLVAYCALYWAALPAVTQVLRKATGLGAPLAFALAVVALEWLRGVLLTGFPWGLWGYSQARNLPLAQLAALGGVYAVSFVIALAGAHTAEVVASRSRPAGLRLLVFALAAHAAGGALYQSRAPDLGPPLRVAVVQGNIDQEIKNRDLEFRTHILDRYLNLTAGAGDVDLVVWPEASFPGYLPIEMRRVPVLRFGHPLLFGVSTRERGPPLRLHNSAMWVMGDGRVVGLYHKQHLVPFGEYVPLRFILPVEKFVPGMVDFSPGASGAPLGEPKSSVLICYDGIFPELARASVRAGATLIANLTNDGWYGVSSAAYQHRDFYVLRAIETDRWVIRAANSGISVLVSPQGRLVGATRLNETTLTRGEVWPRHGRTAYVRLGDWLAAAAVGAFLGSILVLVRWRRRGV